MKAGTHSWVIAVSAVLLACGSRTGLSERAPDAHVGIVEACNLLDDDGDGAIDEDIPNVACGVGVCRREVPGCALGTVPECTPLLGSMELCNGVDDDCDGSIDEELGFGPMHEPVIVREEDIGGSDRCSTCRLAFAPDAIVTDAGILVTWRIGFDGSAPDPNTFSRLLDEWTAPLGDVQLVFGRGTTQGPRAIAAPDGAALVYCGRFGTNDKTTSSLLDPRGRFVSETQRSPTDRSCGAWEPDGIFTGRRFLFAWTDNSSGPVAGNEVLLDLADASGASLGSRELHPEGGSGPRFALGHDRIAMTVEIRSEPRRSQVAVHFFSLDGDALGAPTILEMPDVEAVFQTPHPVATADGWLVVAGAGTRMPGGRFVARLAPDGALVSGPTRVDVGTFFTNGFDDVIARGGGAILASPAQLDGDYAYTVRSLSASGDTVSEWRPNLGAEPGFGQAALLELGGRIYVTYTVSVDETHNQVRIRELGCVP